MSISLNPINRQPSSNLTSIKKSVTPKVSRLITLSELKRDLHSKEDEERERFILQIKKIYDENQKRKRLSEQER